MYRSRNYRGSRRWDIFGNKEREETEDGNREARGKFGGYYEVPIREEGIRWDVSVPLGDSTDEDQRAQEDGGSPGTLGG